MGTLFAHALAERHSVTMLDVRAETIERIAEQGVVVDNEPPRRVNATLAPSAAFTAEVLFVFVKAHDTLKALRPLAGQLDPSAIVVSLQNGLGNEEAIKTALGGTTALVLGITNESCVALAPGHSRRTGVGTTVLGSSTASQGAVRTVAGMLEAGGLGTSVVYDIRPHLWGKLIANAAINPVAALLDRSNGVVTADADASELAHALVREGAAVAKALHVHLPFGDPWGYVREVVAAGANDHNSMTVDLRSHRRTEIDQINGAIVAAGRRAGIATPYNDALVRLVKARERSEPVLC